jgi:excisionase family DNA binding protein
MASVLAIRDTVVVSDAVREEAAALVKVACDQPLTSLKVTVGGETIPIPVELSKFLIHVIENTATGHMMTLRSLPVELTTTAAADELGISRPTLMKLVKGGDIHAWKVGSHSRLRASDVIALKQKRAAARTAAFDALRALENELGES